MVKTASYSLPIDHVIISFLELSYDNFVGSWNFMFLLTLFREVGVGK